MHIIIKVKLSCLSLMVLVIVVVLLMMKMKMMKVFSLELINTVIVNEANNNVKKSEIIFICCWSKW